MDDRQMVIVGMSGGVDSSVAALRLLEEGRRVVGVTLKWWDRCGALADGENCCGPQGIEDARAVCQTLGIRHYVLNVSEAFERDVIGPFIEEYRRGRTPNPCILCNQHIKFGLLLAKARNLGASHVATGHYAIVEKAGSRFVLRKGTDANRDQSYFLFSLDQDQLCHTLMPLGHLTKPEVRRLAARAGLKVHDKKESREICFVPDNDYVRFLETRLGPGAFADGDLCDVSGQFIRRHGGIERFTIGQRKGLGGGNPVGDADLGAVAAGHEGRPARRAVPHQSCSQDALPTSAAEM